MPRLLALAAGLALLLALAPPATQGHGGCGHSYYHTYGYPPFTSKTEAVATPNGPAAVVWDSNFADCNGDGIFYDYDGDLELGLGGGAFGYGPWVAACGHDAAPINYQVSDVTGVPVAFYVGADDQVAASLAPCLADGVIDGSNPNDCLHGPYVTWGNVGPCSGGGDGLVWILLITVDAQIPGFVNVYMPPPTVGTIIAY